jgi:hypothetical protein
MAWFKVDDGFYTSHKVLRIPRETRATAIGAWLLAGTWSADKMTDGKVPMYVLRDFGVEFQTMMTLIDAGLWISGEDDDFIEFHDWCEYQPTREQLEAKAQARHERSVKAANTRWGNEANKDDAKPMLSDAKAMLDDAPEPEPEPLTNTCSSDHEPARPKSPYSADFEQFWKAYPRKQAKGKAWEVYKRLKRAKILPGLDVLIPAAENYELATRHDPQFQKLCEGWLNGHRWQDEPIAKPFSNEPPKKQFTGYEDDDDV